MIAVEVEQPFGVLSELLPCAMSQQLVEHHPPIVSRVLVFLESFCFRRVYKRARHRLVALGCHAVRNDHVFETVFLADVIVLWHMVSKQTAE